jgi:rhamnose utilization protein RhaD (predicted bifunctional aldolase and dehydrogenase)
VSTGTATKNSKVSRDLYHRAIEVMAGARALGEFVSLDAVESFAIKYWPLEPHSSPKPRRASCRARSHS